MKLQNNIMMLQKVTGISFVALYFLAAYFGVAREALLILLPIAIIYGYFKLRNARLDNKLPKDLKFIATLRGDREAFIWGYIILGLMAIFWVFFVAFVAVGSFK